MSSLRELKKYFNNEKNRIKQNLQRRLLKNIK